MAKRKQKGKPMFSNGQGAICHWCGIQCTNTSDEGERGATRDHVMPKSLGPTEMPRVWSCRACNHVKGDLTPAQWRVFRSHIPDWRKLYGVSKLAALRSQFVGEFRAEQIKLFESCLPNTPREIE